LERFCLEAGGVSAWLVDAVFDDMPLLPLPRSNTPYSPNIHNVAQILHSHYETTRAVLSSGNHNKHRLQHHAHLIFNDALPLLLALEEEVRVDKSLMDWLQDVAEQFLGLTMHLLNLEAEADNEGQEYSLNLLYTLTILMMNTNRPSNVFIPQPITVEKKNTRGRPRKVVNADLLKEAMSPTRQISQSLLAKKLGIHRNTLRGKLKENSIDTSFSDISDVDLDQIISSYRDSHPNSGIMYLRGHLRSQGLRIQ